jgi:hypothetical protein
MEAPGCDTGRKSLKIAVDKLNFSLHPLLLGCSTDMPSTLDLTLGAAETGVSIGTLCVTSLIDIFHM